jgi:hypothetical protein
LDATNLGLKHLLQQFVALFDIHETSPILASQRWTVRTDADFHSSHYFFDACEYGCHRPTRVGLRKAVEFEHGGNALLAARLSRRCEGSPLPLRLNSDSSLC